MEGNRIITGDRSEKMAKNRLKVTAAQIAPSDYRERVRETDRQRESARERES